MTAIRQARSDEFDKIGQLWSDFMALNAAFDSSFVLRQGARELFSKEMMERCPDPDCLLSIAEDDGQMIGFCFSYVSRKPRYFKLDKFGFIGDLYVKPEYRRQGVGHELVKDAIRFLSRRKVKQIELLVAVRNEQTIKFWEAIGFSELLTWMYKRL
jgi:ribosomal protein S18 acetylase RimI-like enzyme